MKTIPKLFWGGLILLIALLTGCAGSTADNKGLDYDQLDVVFEISMPDGVELGADALFGVAGTCGRNGAQNVKMSNKGISAYRVTQAQTHLVKSSDEDALIAYGSDTGYQFYGFYPYDPAVADLSVLNADVPSENTTAQAASPLYVAKTSRSSVVAPVKLDFRRMTCTMSFRFADDIVSSESESLKSILLRPADADKLAETLAYNATYNLYTGELYIDQQSAKKEITFNFGEDGIVLDGYTDVACEIAPFTVPEGGFELVFTDVNGNSNTVTIMDGEVGKAYKAGDLISMVVTSAGTVGESTGQSARWPIGFFDGVGGSNPRNQRDSFKDMWPRGQNIGASSHIWPSAENPEFTAEFVFSEEHKAYDINKVMFEFQQNASYNYCSPVVKNFFTNDYWEFTVPVAYLKAGSKVTIEAPIYSRGAPIFWNIEYLDGGVWKCNKYEQESLDVINGSSERAKATCTWVLPHGAQIENFEGVLMTHSMIFENAIKDGQIKIRMRAVGDEKGIYMTHLSSTYSNKAYLHDKPVHNDGNALVAFCNKSNTYDAITIKW